MSEIRASNYFVKSPTWNIHPWWYPLTRSTTAVIAWLLSVTWLSSTWLSPLHATNEACGRAINYSVDDNACGFASFRLWRKPSEAILLTAWSIFNRELASNMRNWCWCATLSSKFISWNENLTTHNEKRMSISANPDLIWNVTAVCLKCHRCISLINTCDYWMGLTLNFPSNFSPRFVLSIFLVFSWDIVKCGPKIDY